MRISDWSSDVCSSDLLARFFVHHLPNEMFIRLQSLRRPFDNPIQQRQVPPVLHCRVYPLAQQPGTLDGLQPLTKRCIPPAAQQNGRAQGSARRCQDGYVSGVAVAIKTRTTNVTT